MSKADSILALTHPIYSDPHAAREHLEELHWPNGPVCPRCGETERLKRAGGRSTRPGVINCNACRKPFTVTVGTIFEDSKIPLNKWLLGFRLMAGSKKGISAHQLHRSLGITYKSAWFMAHRIREAMNQPSGPLGGEPSRIVEADETYVGGKSANRAYAGVPKKAIVLTLVERGGHARSFHIANVHANTIRPLLYEHADRLSSLMTDESLSYVTAGRGYWQHQTVNHKMQEYSRPGGWHTNTVESFFSIFKRGIIGTYHHSEPGAPRPLLRRVRLPLQHPQGQRSRTYRHRDRRRPREAADLSAACWRTARRLTLVHTGVRAADIGIDGLGRGSGIGSASPEA